MITGEIKSKVDKIWETFWTGGITNPLTVIEQFTYLLYIKSLDEREKEKESGRLGSSLGAVKHILYWGTDPFILHFFHR